MTRSSPGENELAEARASDETAKRPTVVAAQEARRRGCVRQLQPRRPSDPDLP